MFDLLEEVEKHNRESLEMLRELEGKLEKTEALLHQATDQRNRALALCDEFKAEVEKICDGAFTLYIKGHISESYLRNNFGLDVRGLAKQTFEEWKAQKEGGS